MILAATLVLALAPAPQNLKLPPSDERPGTAAPVQRPTSEIERFRRKLAELRGSPADVERALREIADEFPDVEGLIVQRLGSAMARELLDLMMVAERFGSPRVADEILFQLLARPVGDSTRAMLERLVHLKGSGGAKQALRDCILGRIAGVRRIATEILARLADADDLEFALLLVDEQALDLKLSGIELLAALPAPAPAARQRLCRLLAKDPTVAGAACQALLGLGDAAVPFLQEVVAGPAIDRSYAYSAFALAVLDRDGSQLPPAAAVPALERALGGSDPLARSLAAVGLGAMCFHGHADGVRDAEVVDALLEVVAPTAFVPNFELMRRPAEGALRRLTGRNGAELVSWRDWWRDARGEFAGLRARIELDAKAAGLAVVSLREERRHVRVLGEDLADLPPVAGALEYVLEREQLLRLVEDLRGRGFMQPGAIEVPSGLPSQRALELVVGDARTQVAAPTPPFAPFDQLAEVIEQHTRGQLWQLLRHPTDEPERGAFWRAERRYRAAQADPRELQRRSLQRAIKVWPVASPVQRRMVLAWMLELPGRAELLRTEDGAALLAIVRDGVERGALTEDLQVLLELAVSAPGDEVWRDGVDLAARADGGGRAAVDRLFRVLGADRVLQALSDPRPTVRRAAIDEVVEVRDLRAEERLLAMMFGDPELPVRRAAIYAAGQLRLPAARQELVARIDADDTDPMLRRDALIALGRIGGEGVFAALQRALGAVQPGDREAALRGLGELRDPRAAAQLAQVLVASLGTPIGELARTYLQRMGGPLAVPALREQLRVEHAGVHGEVVLMLAAWQDPTVVPDLIGLLQQRREPLLVKAMLASTTGLDIDSVADPVLALQNWHRDHRMEPQWLWLLQALERESIPTSLDRAQFAAGVSTLAAVPELARLMVEAEAGRLRVLAAAVLRGQTGEDFGQVTPGTPIEVRRTIAARYRELYEGARAAQGR
ncbi:MAG: HEAT repeat domain-containing protein [Planctomycetota bacterium]